MHKGPPGADQAGARVRCPIWLRRRQSHCSGEVVPGDGRWFFPRTDSCLPEARGGRRTATGGGNSGTRTSSDFATSSQVQPRDSRMSVVLAWAFAWSGDGRAIGRRMLDACLSLARSAGIEKVELEVFSDNVAAVRLYESLRFGREGLKVRGPKTGRSISGHSTDGPVVINAMSTRLKAPACTRPPHAN